LPYRALGAVDAMDRYEVFRSGQHFVLLGCRPILIPLFFGGLNLAIPANGERINLHLFERLSALGCFRPFP
jgi:hypothetical protein